VWTSAKLVYVTYAAYGEQLFGHVSLPAFGSDPSESLPAKRTRRAPAKLDADDAAAAADEESYNSGTPAPRSKSPGRGARSTPARRAAATPRK
jgi:hypothetical protein